MADIDEEGWECCHWPSVARAAEKENAALRARVAELEGELDTARELAEQQRVEIIRLRGSHRDLMEDLRLLAIRAEERFEWRFPAPEPAPPPEEE
jgi:predicted nuclease with TOPRIM domain